MAMSDRGQLQIKTQTHTDDRGINQTEAASSDSVRSSLLSFIDYYVASSVCEKCVMPKPASYSCILSNKNSKRFSVILGFLNIDIGLSWHIHIYF